MPLDDAHRFRDAIRSAPAIFGNRGNFLECGRCGDGVVNVPPPVGNVCVEVIGGAEDKAHAGDRENEGEKT